MIWSPPTLRARPLSVIMAPAVIAVGAVYVTVFSPVRNPPAASQPVRGQRDREAVEVAAAALQSGGRRPRQRCAVAVRSQAPALCAQLGGRDLLACGRTWNDALGE